MAKHNLDVQQVADMLENDNCPASMGMFNYPDGSDGLLLLMAQPKYHAKIDAFLKQLYAEEGYESPQYPKAEPVEKLPVVAYQATPQTISFLQSITDAYYPDGHNPEDRVYSFPAWLRFRLKPTGSDRPDSQAIALLQKNRFESDALYLKTDDLTAACQAAAYGMGHSDFDRMIEDEKNYKAPVQNGIAAAKKVYFVHPNGGIRLIKLQ